MRDESVLFVCFKGQGGEVWFGPLPPVALEEGETEARHSDR